MKYVVRLELDYDYYERYYLSRYGAIKEPYKINDFDRDEFVFDSKEEAEKIVNSITSIRNYSIDEIESLDEII